VKNKYILFPLNPAIGSSLITASGQAIVHTAAWLHKIVFQIPD